MHAFVRFFLLRHHSSVLFSSSSFSNRLAKRTLVTPYVTCHITYMWEWECSGGEQMCRCAVGIGKSHMNFRASEGPPSEAHRRTSDTMQVCHVTRGLIYGNECIVSIFWCDANTTASNVLHVQSRFMTQHSIDSAP